MLNGHYTLYFSCDLTRVPTIAKRNRKRIYTRYIPGIPQYRPAYKKSNTQESQPSNLKKIGTALNLLGASAARKLVPACGRPRPNTLSHHCHQTVLQTVGITSSRGPS